MENVVKAGIFGVYKNSGKAIRFRYYIQMREEEIKTRHSLTQHKKYPQSSVQSVQSAQSTREKKYPPLSSQNFK